MTLLWHGSFDHITQFKPFFHCGTWKAAVNRVKQKGRDKGLVDTIAYFYPIKLKTGIKLLKFLDFSDDFHASELLQTLINDPVYGSKMTEYAQKNKMYNRQQIVDNVYKFCLINKIDGFYYDNYVEDRSISYIIVNLKSITVSKPKEINIKDLR